MNETEKTVIRWHHAPMHVFLPGRVYMVTAGTLHKEHCFRGRARLKLLVAMLHTAISA